MSRITNCRLGNQMNWPQVYFGVALTTCSTLLLELTLTRIFSVVFYYHFAFMAISIALFGLGAGGVLSYALTKRIGNVFQALGLLASLTSVATVAAVTFVLSRSSDSNLTLALIYFVCAVPFVLSGMILSIAISRTMDHVDRVYCFDLLGAATGCIVLVPLLDVLGGPNTMLAAAGLFAVTASLWFSLGSHSRGRICAVVLTLALVALIAINLQHRWIDVHYAKGMPLTGETFVKWNSFSRVAMRPDRYSGRPEILIDADASTGIASFDFDKLSEADRKDLTGQGPAFPYRLRPGAKTLVIGAGGGWDIARAIIAGSHDITGVEINPIIARTIMQQRFPQLSNRLYLRPDVRIAIEDGRSFVRRSAEHYQVIQLTLVDTWASTAAGAFALSESNLYTVEAFEDYFRHLSDDGILAFTRWGFDPPRESLRLLSLANSALANLGEQDFPSHYIVGREGGSEELHGWGARDTVILSRKPLAASDVESARVAMQQMRMTPVYLPGAAIDNDFNRFLQARDSKTFLANYRYDISPVTDDRPFFFYTVQPRDLLGFFAANARAADLKINRAVPLLFGVIGISVAATLVILILPPLALGRALPRDRRTLTFLLYFVMIGAAYILVQVALIQKFVLYLGHPTFALTVIICSMLVFSGLGSLFSRKLAGEEGSRLPLILVAAVAANVVLAFVAPVVAESGITWPVPAKIATTFALLAIPTFLMGIPFPTALSAIERSESNAVRWAWALNAAASVMGSAVAIAIGIYLGLKATLLCGAALYLIALLLWRFRSVDSVRTAGYVLDSAHQQL